MSSSRFRLVVTPRWAKLIEFEMTLPSAVEELARQREERLTGLSNRDPVPAPGRGTGLAVSSAKVPELAE
jgi:hypothetical protein